MDPRVSTLILILIALLGARFSFSTIRIPPGPRLVFRTGTHFLILGFALGPHVLGLLTQDAILQLFPLLGLGLGWIGFLFGLQLDRRHLAQFPLAFHVLALGQAVVAFFIFLGVGWLGLRLFDTNGEVIQVVLLGAAATAYSLFPPQDLVTGLPATPSPEWTVVALGLGVVCGILFLWFTRPRPGGEELVLFLLGIAAFASGAALQLQLSPLFVSVVMGAVVANLSPDPDRVFRVLQEWEKPIYVVFLMLAGALLSFSTFWIVVLALAYALLRAGGKVVGGMAMVRLLPFRFQTPKRFGLGLLPQGGISLAMAISVVLTYSGMEMNGISAVDFLFGVVVLGVILSELSGPFLTRNVFQRAGEIAPLPQGTGSSGPLQGERPPPDEGEAR
jgi:hypothetical protein